MSWKPTRGGFLAQVAIMLTAKKEGEPLYWREIAFLSSGSNVNYLKALIDNGWAVVHTRPKTRKEQSNPNPSWVRGPNLPPDFQCKPMGYIRAKIDAREEKSRAMPLMALPRRHVSTERYVQKGWESARQGADDYKKYRSLGFNAPNDFVSRNHA